MIQGRYCIAYLAEQNIELSEEMVTLRKDFKGAFEVFANNIEENFKELKDNADTNKEVISKALVGLFNSVAALQKTSESESKPTASKSSAAKQTETKQTQRQIKTNHSYSTVFIFKWIQSSSKDKEEEIFLPTEGKSALHRRFCCSQRKLC